MEMSQKSIVKYGNSDSSQCDTITIDPNLGLSDLKKLFENIKLAVGFTGPDISANAINYIMICDVDQCIGLDISGNLLCDGLSTGLFVKNRLVELGNQPEENQITDILIHYVDCVRRKEFKKELSKYYKLN